MIICKSLKSIYEKDLNNFYFCAVPDYEDDQIIKTKKVFGIQKKYKYVNSGFLLMNLHEIRTSVSDKDLTSFIIRNASNLPYLDQDVLNILFSSKILYAGEDYNYDCRYKTNAIKERLEFVLKEYLFNRKSKRYVLHFKGRSKPWNKNYNGKFCCYFLKYAKLMRLELKN
jgi:lipopolysaccharide biosynthesis glycosyltransferase